MKEILKSPILIGDFNLKNQTTNYIAKGVSVEVTTGASSVTTTSATVSVDVSATISGTDSIATSGTATVSFAITSTFSTTGNVGTFVVSSDIYFI